MKKIILFLLTISNLNAVFAQCDIPRSVPYIENFYAGTGLNSLPICSKNETETGAAGFWKGYPSTTGGVINADFGSFSNGIRIWWISPKILVEMGKSYRLIFKYQGLSLPLTSPFLFVKFGTCDSSICMTNNILPVSIPDSSKRTFNRVFSPGISDTINIGIYFQADQIEGCSVNISNLSLVEESPTPVTMGTLAAQIQGSSTNLYWQTYTEQNNRGFYVEQSLGGQPFGSLDFVPAKNSNGNSILPVSYQFTATGTGAAQYRLRQQDFNGAVTYSNIVTVSGKTKGFGVKILPNPIVNNLQASLYSPTAYKGMVQIISSTGWPVHTQTVSLPAGYSSLTIPAGSWAAGSYFIKVNGVAVGFVK